MSAPINARTLEDILMGALPQLIAERADIITEEAVAKLRQCMRDEVSRAAISISNFVSFKTMGNEIVITIRDEREKKNGANSTPV